MSSYTYLCEAREAVEKRIYETVCPSTTATHIVMSTAMTKLHRQFHTLQHADNLLLAYGQHYLFSGVPLLECCRVDDASPENTIVGLHPS